MLKTLIFFSRHNESRSGIVFVVTTLAWLPWLWPYLKDALGRLERRFAR